MFCFADPSSQNVVLVILLILLTFFTLITTAIVFLRRAYRRASVRQCSKWDSKFYKLCQVMANVVWVYKEKFCYIVVEDAKKKSEDEESLQCLNK